MQQETPQQTAERLSFVIGRLTRALRLAKGGLSHGLLSALATVAKYAPIRLADLAQIEQVSAPSITRVVADLEAQGLVSRSQDPDDGRAWLIDLTDAGQQAIVVARLAREEIVAELLAPLAHEQRAALEAALPALERMIEGR